MPKNFVGEPLLCCVSEIFPVVKKLMDERGGGESRFSVQNFLSHSAERIRKGTLYTFTNFGYAKKLFASEGYVVIFDFLSQLFCLTVPRNFVGKPFSVSLPSGAEEVWIREWGGSLKIFCRKFSFSHCRKFS